MIFYEYINIFLKLIQFDLDETINREKIHTLIKEQYLIEEKENFEKTLSVEDYIIYLKYIPLKYINYHLNEKGKLYFYYSFPLFKYILNDFLNYYDSRHNFFFSQDGNERGTSFENILKIQFRVFNKLKIDGYLEVKSIINMNFTEDFKLLDKKYIEGKKNIFIAQKNKGGQDYDFAIYKPEVHQLLLVQSKYSIDNNLIKHKKEYVKSSLDVLNNFKKVIDDKNIQNVYLLYISSEEYNIKKKKTVKSLLEKNEINCLFYSVKDDKFSFNFEKKVHDLECEDSFLLYPKFGTYKKQEIKL